LHPLCRQCFARGIITPATVVDHIKPHGIDASKAQPTAEQIRLFWNEDNWQSMCKPHHDEKSLLEDGGAFALGGAASRPEWLPQPRCTVHLVCGPPASGKSTYVLQHQHPQDTVIDLDFIMAEISGRELYQAPASWLATAIRVRNKRLAGLAAAPRHSAAWFIVGGASPAIRSWWSGKLNSTEPVVMRTPLAMCIARIKADPRRALVEARQIAAAREWFEIEAGRKMVKTNRGGNRDGIPTDPAHPWAMG
jgi:5-methylcytosine-specific restriction protein A